MRVCLLTECYVLPYFPRETVTDSSCSMKTSFETLAKSCQCAQEPTRVHWGQARRAQASGVRRHRPSDPGKKTPTRKSWTFKGTRTAMKTSGGLADSHFPWSEHLKGTTERQKPKHVVLA